MYLLLILIGLFQRRPYLVLQVAWITWTVLVPRAASTSWNKKKVFKSKTHQNLIVLKQRTTMKSTRVLSSLLWKYLFKFSYKKKISLIWFRTSVNWNLEMLNVLSMSSRSTLGECDLDYHDHMISNFVEMKLWTANVSSVNSKITVNEYDPDYYKHCIINWSSH